MPRRMVMLGVLATLALGALSATTAAAAGSYRPDGWIQARQAVPGGPWKGQNIYNTTGLNQTAKLGYMGTNLGLGESFFFDVNIQNDGATSDRFKVKAPSSSWKIKYFHGSTNITSAVVAGTYQTSSLAPGSSSGISVKVDLDTMPAGDTATRLITITSSSDSTKKDAVQLKLKHITCGC